MEQAIAAFQVGLDIIAHNMDSDHHVPALLMTCKEMHNPTRSTRFAEERQKTITLAAFRYLFFHLQVLIADNRWIPRTAAASGAFHRQLLTQTVIAEEEFRFTRAFAQYNDDDGEVRRLIDPEDRYRLYYELMYERNGYALAGLDEWR